MEPQDNLDLIIRRLIGPVFIVLAIILYNYSGSSLPTIPDPAGVSTADLSTEPMRELLGNPPVSVVNGFERKCMECHQLFESNPITPEKLIQHSNIIMDHGMNKTCYNCHHTKDRNKLVLRGGKTTDFNNVELLCAQCHGTTYRDWQKGMHGKTLGHWDIKQGQPEKLACTQCHDPHSPAFKSMKPLPGPNTLRMGDPKAVKEHYTPDHEVHQPLRTWSKKQSSH